MLQPYWFTAPSFDVWYLGETQQSAPGSFEGDSGAEFSTVPCYQNHSKVLSLLRKPTSVAAHIVFPGRDFSGFILFNALALQIWHENMMSICINKKQKEKLECMNAKRTHKNRKCYLNNVWKWTSWPSLQLVLDNTYAPKEDEINQDTIKQYWSTASCHF